ncbi:protein kinase, partial [Streptomyces sp. H27-D2]
MGPPPSPSSARSRARSGCGPSASLGNHSSRTRVFHRSPPDARGRRALPPHYSGSNGLGVPHAQAWQLTGKGVHGDQGAHDVRPVGSKYLLEEAIGRGATGTVWRARQRETAGAEAAVAGRPGELVAIKVLKEELAEDPDIVMRFLRERSVLLRLTHPNIV